MEKKDIYFQLEFFLTVIVLFLVIFLLAEIIYNYRLYIIFGLICGFGFSWFTRGKQVFLISFLTKVATLGVFLWIIYSIINSSLFYIDVILIWIWGVLILEVILSFNAGFPVFLTYIQVLSIPLFMSYPALIKGYNRISFILMSGYVLCWFAVLKVKFYGFIKSESKGISLRKYSIYLLMIFSLICVSVSWIIFSKVPLGKIREGGFLPEERMSSEDNPVKMQKQYYDLQDLIQREIAKLIPALESADEKYEILGLLNSLIKDSPYIMEVRKAEHGLIDYLKREGYGLEGKYREELTLSIKSYLDKKIALILKMNKNNIEKVLKRNAFNIKERISIISLINNMQHANNYQQMRKNGRDINKIINKPTVNIDTKRQLKELTGQFKEWKKLQIYRQESDYLQKNIDSLDGQLKNELSNLQSEIEKIENLSDLKDTGARIAELKETALPLTGEHIKTIEGLMDLKLEMMLSEKNRELKEKLKSSDLLENKLKELEEEADTIKDIENSQDFLEGSSKFQEKIKENKLNINQEIKELSEIKIHSFVKEKIEKVRDLLKQSVLSVDSAREFMKELEKIESDKEIKDVILDGKKLQDDIENFSNQDFILKETKDNLIKEIEGIKTLLLYELKTDDQAEGERPLKDRKPTGFQKGWEELLEESSLREERKETLKHLTQELFKARTISQIENVKDAVKKEIVAALKEGMQEQEKNRLEQAFQELAWVQRMFTIEKELSDLREEIEQLKKTNPEEARKLEEFLKKIGESSANEQIEEVLDNLKQLLKSNSKDLVDFQKLKNKQGIAQGLSSSLQIYIFPSYLIVPIDSYCPLKAIAIYNKKFIKELDSDLEWFSSDTSVAWVDKKGFVKALSKGKTNISADYKGISSQEVEVIVVEKLSEATDIAIKKELVK